MVRIGKIKHSYPLCWRSHHPIVWLARKGWFYKLDKLGEKAINAAERVDYFLTSKEQILGNYQRKTSLVHIPRKVLGMPTSCMELFGL